MSWKIFFNVAIKLVKDNVQNYVGDIDFLKGIKFRDLHKTREKFQNYKIGN